MTVTRTGILALVTAGLVAALPSCRGGGSEARERAYRINNLGAADLEEFKYPAAIEAFQRALQVDRSLAIAHLNLSLALLYADDLRQAGQEANEAMRLLPTAPQPHYVLGLIARAENRETDAEREFGWVHRTDPADVGTNINLGQIYLGQRQYAQAITFLTAAARAEPFNVTAAYNLGLALMRSGQETEGQATLQRTQTLRATGYAVVYGAGYLEQGRYAEAITSNGAEPDLVDARLPPARFVPARIAPAAGEPPQPQRPFGRRFTAGDLTAAGMSAIASGLGGCLTLIDANADGHLELFDASAAGQHLYRHTNREAWIDVTGPSGLDTTPRDGIPVGCVAGDYDNDGLPDLFVLRYGASSLYHNEGGGRFTDATRSAGIPNYPFLPGAAAFVDVDHDGDLDLVIAGLADLAGTRSRAEGRSLLFPADFMKAPLLLLRNNGNGTFADITAEGRVGAELHAVAVVPTDFDNRRDIDMLIMSYGDPPLLFQNQRDGTFRDVAADVGLTSIVGSDNAIETVAAADVNKDDFPDFFFGRSSGGVFALSDGRGRFTAAPAPEGVGRVMAAQFLDYDNDGLLDLLTWSHEGPHLFRNLGGRWANVTASALPGARASPGLSSARRLNLVDLDGDGRTDLVTGGQDGLSWWRNDGPANHHSLRVTLKGRVGNPGGVGSKIEIRAGSLSSRLETSAATPPIAPADIVFGLGNRPRADAVRVLWPSGILQAEAEPGGLPTSVTVAELNRKPSSCPFLFAWNGRRFEFVTDFLGAGEMGYLERPGARDAFNTPDPVEYVRIDSSQLQPRDGRFELRVTNELEETLFADRFQLLAVAHPPGIQVYPSAGMTGTPKPLHLFAVTDARVPRAVDDRGLDVTDRVAEIDRRYADGFALERFRGYAAAHALTLDLGPLGSAPVLLLTGWTDYAFSSDNLAAHQAGLSLTPPMLQARDRGGRWRTVVDDIGIPIGRPQTVTIDLAGRLRPGEHVVRIVTNMRIYWDRVLVATAIPDARVHVHALDPVTATLQARGFSAEVRPDGNDPPLYDYGRVSVDSPWKTLAGRYTREGDVRALLTRTDDMSVIAMPGDEIALSFDAAAAGPLPPGWLRTFVLVGDGFSKEMDINSASPDVIGPIPFHAMPEYPYRTPRRGADTPAYRHYQADYNTRVVARPVPSLDVVMRRRDP